MNILQVYDHMELGGAESHILTLSKALIDRGHSVHLAAPEGPSSYKVNDLKIQHHLLELKKTSRLLENLFELVKIINQNDIDIVHVHPFQSQVVAGLLPFLLKVPIVTTIHGPYLTPSTNKLKPIYKNYIFVSEEIRKHHVQRNLISRADKVEIIPNSVPSGGPLESNNNFNETLKITYISRLDRDKLPSIKFFLRSIKKIASFINIDVKVIGKGEKLEEVLILKNKINDSIGKNIITVIEGTNFISKYIEKSDVVVGVGRVILEAISCKKIAICMGNKYYVGIIDSTNLLEISKVNFTDRACSEKLSTESFLRDLISINKGEVQKETEKTYNLLMSHFDIKLSAEKHERFYQDVISSNMYNKINTKKMSLFNDYFFGANSISEGLQLIEEGYSYNLAGTKQYKILIHPDFNDEKDSWRNILKELLKNETIQTAFSLVIRIENKYQDKLNQIIQEIEDILAKQKSTLDVLVDCEFQDTVTQIIFLSSIDVFIPTSSQKTLEFKCKLLNKRIVHNGILSSDKIPLCSLLLP
ncbi:glycosyltransferase [Lysinibacillus sphaericus]